MGVIPAAGAGINARYVFDMIYDPAETRFLKLAKERGAQIIPGIEMFVHQAARQFEIWTGKPAPGTKCCAWCCSRYKSAPTAHRGWKISDFRCVPRRKSCIFLLHKVICI